MSLRKLIKQVMLSFLMSHYEPGFIIKINTLLVNDANKLTNNQLIVQYDGKCSLFMYMM